MVIPNGYNLFSTIHTSVLIQISLAINLTLIDSHLTRHLPSLSKFIFYYSSVLALLGLQWRCNRNLNFLFALFEPTCRTENKAYAYLLNSSYPNVLSLGCPCDMFPLRTSIEASCQFLNDHVGGFSINS